MQAVPGNTKPINLMIMHAYGLIMDESKNALNDSKAPKRLKNMVQSLDGMLTTCRSMMHYDVYDGENMRIIQYPYWDRMAQIQIELNKLDTGDEIEREKYTEWVLQWLELVASSFQLIGITPKPWRVQGVQEIDADVKPTEYINPNADDEEAESLETLPEE